MPNQPPGVTYREALDALREVHRTLVVEVGCALLRSVWDMPGTVVAEPIGLVRPDILIHH